MEELRSKYEQLRKLSKAIINFYDSLICALRGILKNKDFIKMVEDMGAKETKETFIKKRSKKGKKLKTWQKNKFFQ